MPEKEIAPAAMKSEDIQMSEADEKWGGSIKAGYQILPDTLIRGQRLLKLNATDIVVIANLNQAWWFKDRLPYLKPHTIAKRMGVSERSVQRSLQRLRRLNYLEQIRSKNDDGTFRYFHDLSGLRRKLEELAKRDIEYSDWNRKQNQFEIRHSVPPIKGKDG